MNFFDKYFYPPVNFWSVWFAETVIRNLKNHSTIEKNKSYLDIGCGLGNLCFSLNEFSPSEVYGFDLSGETIKLLQEFTDKIKFRKFNICKDDIRSYENMFDTVFSCDVYEHVEDPQLMLNNIYRMLKFKGKLSMTFPNFNDHGHNQVTRIEDLEDMLRKAGFRLFNIYLIKDRSFIYKFFTGIYVILQDISDIVFGIKRNSNRMPESDKFHEMYAYKKINKLKKHKFLIIFINLVYELFKKTGRLSSVFILERFSVDLQNKRLLIYAEK
ncbi:MAG: class I SAM-dependent methyltransferase [Ignavibacteria bacterium]|nr:class I SAM-dependent methyltransferase [Ignavibacteria bacterium]